jgi:hypothetical protein
MVDLRSLLVAAEEFVEYMVNQQKSDECFVATRPSISISAAQQHRKIADRIERDDQRIDRARSLLPKISEVLRETDG